MISTGICRWLFLLISLSTWTKLIDSKEMRIVCYYTNWSVYRPGQAKFSPQNINPYLCTHLVYAFGGFTKENTLKPFDKYQDIEKGGYAKFTGLKTYNKDLKTLIAIGGWNEGSTRFSSMVASSERRKELVKNTIKFLRQNHFDGLDLDWEYPTFRDGGKPRDRDNYAQLVKELREEFERESEKTGRPRLLLTMAVPAGIEYINKGYDVPKLTKYLDWMNILSYDYHSAFEPAVNHHAPLYSLEEDSEYNYDGELNIDYTIKHYLKMGADPNKLVLGIPTYGRSYTLFNPEAYEIGSPADGPGDMGEATRENGYLAYYEICENVKNQDWEVEEPFPKAMGPIAFKDNQWVGYDDENIVRKKAEYVAENSLGGIMFWAIDNDDFRGNCHGKPYPLIEAGKEALINAYGLTEDNLISPPAKPTKLPKKQRPRTSRTTTTERSEEIVEETTTRRRRIKPKIRNDNQLATPAKKRRNESGRKAAETSTYSSLKIVTPAYTTPEPPATPDMGGAFKCEDEGFFPHPKDCKKYFWCLGGPGDTGIVAHQFTCPAGLHFNKAADSCDYSQNVFCNKKSKPSTTTTKAGASTSTEASSSAKPTVNSVFSTTRAPPKITAATSKTTINFRTTTTTEAYEDEEYEDEEEEEPNKREESEEDPQVIKELIDLIRKAGGIEELEKQLKFGKDFSPSTSSSDATTPSAISKSLYERVLSKTSKNTLSALKKTNRNSGGRQGNGEEASRGKQSDTRGRPQYKTLTRQRSSTEEPREQDTDSEDTDSKTRGSYRPTSSLEYVNIRRPKASTTTEANDESGFSRNKILGEFDSESDEEITEDVTRRNNIPQYVNISRQRPSTTEPSASSTKYSAVRRSTLSPVDPESEVDPEDKKYNIIRRGSTTEATTTSQEPTNLRYQTLRRGTTTTPTSPTEADTTEITRRRLTTTQASTTISNTESRYSILRRTTTPSSIDQEDTTAKYQTVSRETTTSSTPSTSSTIKSTTELKEEERTEEPTTELDAIGTTLPQEASSNIKTVTTENITPSSTHKSTTESKNNSVGSSLNTTTGSPVESETKKKRPSLFQPRPFSIGSTTEKSASETTTTPASKVSQSSFKFRVRSTTTPSPDTVSTINTTIRPRARGRFSNANRNLNEDKEQQEKIERTAESKPVRTRKRVITTTEFPVDSNEEVDRKYRPAELADLSSLTAADLNLRGGEFNSRNRRRRPATIKPISSSTEKSLEESAKTGPNTLTLARKSIDATAFGKSRRLNTTGDDQTNASTNQAAAKKFGRGFRTTTPKATVEISTTNSTTEETPLSSSSSSARTRKIIRRFRPGSAPTSTEKPSSEPISVTSTTGTPRLVRKRIPLFRQRPNKSTSTTAATSTDDTTTTTESSLGQLFKPRSRFEVAKNDTKKTDEEIEEDELSNEHTDVLNGEEGENIKLSESNIRESSQINAFAFDDKPKKRRFGKPKEAAIVKPEKEEETTTTTTAASTTKLPEADDTNNTPIEPSRIIRTRKIIRKLSTTPATTAKNAATAEGNKKQRILLVGRSRASHSDQIKARPNNPRFRGRTSTTTESSTEAASTTTSLPISSTEPEAVTAPKETTEKRRTFRPNFAKRTTEEPEEDDAKSEEPPTLSTTTESFASTKFPRLSLYTRPPFSTTEVDHDDEEFNFEADNDDEEGFADDSDDDEDEDDYMPKYTIFTTSSIERMHKFESNTNFNDEDEEGVDVPPKTNKSVSSLVYTKALNSRKESEKILNKNTGEEEQIRKEEEARNKLLEDEKERAAFIRERVALGKEEIASQSQKDLLKSRVGYRSETTAYVAPITDSPESTIRSDVENELNYSTVAQETTENLDSTTIKINLSTDAETDKTVLSTTEKLAETTLNIIANSDVENEATEAVNTSSTDETTTASVEETTNPIISNSTETTTEFRRRSTLRSIKDRPKLGLGRRVSKRPSASSTTTEPTLSSSTRRGFTRSFTRGRTQKTTAALDASTKPVTRASRSTSPLPLNKLLYRYSTTARNRFDSDLDGEDDEEEEGDEYDDDEEEVEEHENSLNSRPLFSQSSTTSPRVVNRPADARKTKKAPNKPKFSKASLTSSTTEKSSLEDLGVDTEAVKNRNKNLFSKRKMNTPIPYSSTTPLVELSSLETTTTTPNTSGTDSTDPNLTTLHHIFAEIGGDVDTTTEMMNPSSVTNAGKLERLIEVNRIVEVKTKQAKVKNHAGQIEEDTRVESLPTLDKIGEISRITLIKIVDGNSETVIKDPESNEIGTSLESRTQFAPVYSPPLEVAKVEEIPSSAVLQNVNLKNFQFDIKMDVGDAAASERQERTFQIFGESKVANSKEVNPDSTGKPEIIDGISHINVVTPKPLLVTEASTISLQGLFQTEKPHLNPSFTTNDEVLETGRSEFVNVRVLDQDLAVNLAKGQRSMANFIPVRVLPQDNEESTVQAHVMEIIPRPGSRTIKIVPIQVEMSRRLDTFRLPTKESGINT
ncbi:serine-rich adhesin for platelets [Dendroctonus ponderosae]|uniref:serine-rich adhesin for platelets n=1 Tax=Dendroctonus ponderosae TaxID=77166 RepID=UPI0020360EF5|nr:serine-rich adhesin for platelets [Dendroctonus ponderosae]